MALKSPTNRLSSETSPYLLQHAANPVNWFPWGDEAFNTAKIQNKLMLISIGYSSCHWCHVMEKEIFSNPQVAEYMNEFFVCVKVDREERPDVDQIYMNAVQIITRSGGWPLNCFALPDGRPVFGGTYFPKNSWIDILESLQNTWENDHERVIAVAEELTEGITNTEIIKGKREINEISRNDLKEYVDSWSKYFDTRYGANKGAPKFPMPGSLDFLLSYSSYFHQPSIQKHVKLTLDRMKDGGIFDHVGGGFFRYSVDEQWNVPHFEKMLYDNAQLLSLYANAFKHFKDEKYRQVAYQIVDFLRREMRSDDGGFYSAIDADSEGEEGNYYTWNKSELDALLGEDAKLFSIAYGISAAGNHQGRNVLKVSASHNETACVLGLEENAVVESLKKAKLKLMNSRSTRVRPITDDKRIAAWNALTVSALINAFAALGDSRFLSDALIAAQFIDEKLTNSDGTLSRIYCKGEKSISGFLDDYAFTIQAYIAIYRSTFEEEWLQKAQDLAEITISKFLDAESGMFFFSQKSHENLIARKMELTDGVIPSSAAIMADNLLELSVYFRNQQYADMAKQMLSNIRSQMDKGGSYVYKWADVQMKSLVGPAEVAAAGNDGKDMLLSILQQSIHPFCIPYLYHSSSMLPISKNPVNDGDIRLCIGKTCKTPTSSTDEVLMIINGGVDVE